MSLLRLYSQVNQTKEIQAYELSLRDVCSRALDATSSYTIVLEVSTIQLPNNSISPYLMQCIQSGRTLVWKEEWLSRGVKCVLSAPPSTTTSHQCLELLMNSVLLSVSLGRANVALGTLEAALFGSSEKPFAAEFKGI